MAEDKPKSLADCTDEDYATMNEIVSQEPGLHRVVLNDKLKNLADELTALAEWLACNGWNSSLPVMRDKAAEVRAMAERVRGKVFISPSYVGPGKEGENWSAWVDDWDTAFTGYGTTKDDAIANLQATLDQQKE